MCTCPTIRLRNKVDGREVLFNVEDAPELCRGDWEVLEPKDEALENADELKAEEAAGDVINNESVPTPEDKVAIDELIKDAETPETTDEKPKVIPSEAIIEDEVIMPAESE